MLCKQFLETSVSQLPYDRARISEGDVKKSLYPIALCVVVALQSQRHRRLVQLLQGVEDVHHFRPQPAVGFSTVAAEKKEAFRPEGHIHFDASRINPFSGVIPRQHDVSHPKTFARRSEGGGFTGHLVSLL
jgi:hypothetical protein